ncbi:hypothetical protein [Albimonas pacifica]|uniref:hypothetical protein n=1 Tax=Albimonas pacifica TaxID=1114924 RepID=UPI0011607D63|nr:hypothetical protein [Albimonas pacifica]
MAKRAKQDGPKLPTPAVARRYIDVAREAGASEVRIEADGSLRVILKPAEGQPTPLQAWKSSREAG